MALHLFSSNHHHPFWKPNSSSMAGTLNPLSIPKTSTRRTLSVLTKRKKRTGSSFHSSVPQAVVSTGLFFASMAFMDGTLEQDKMDEDEGDDTVYDSDSSTDDDNDDQASFKSDSVDHNIPFYFPPSTETCSTIIFKFDCDTFEEEWAEFEAEMIRFNTKHAVFDKSESSWFFPYPIKLLAYCGRDFIAMFVLIPALMFVFLAGLAYLALPVSADLEEED
ncbi:hypothetical protein C8J56DRAFT_29631 [Mycena floridula]|nr:hypothetical protein C8J56DRAFT_29631 [Mycena floridula]